MADLAAKDDKFTRYRERKRRAGLRPLRMWVPDTRGVAFQAEVDRQIALLRGAPEQDETLEFLEAIEREDGWPQ